MLLYIVLRPKDKVSCQKLDIKVAPAYSVLETGRSPI